MEINLKENERIDDLEYKGLKIIQNKDGFCFGVDSVLLSDYAKNIKKNSKVVDIGTGTGIISLLLCKKTELSKIYGIEIQEDVAEMANRSIILNNLEHKFEIINTNIKNITEVLEPHKFDVVVTNPPYKKADTGVKSIDRKQLISRHEVECTLEDVIKASSELLKPHGKLFMVHRPSRLGDIFALMREYKLEPKIMRLVAPLSGKEPNMVLVCGIKSAKSDLKIIPTLFVYNVDGSYTKEIDEIYGR